MASEISYIFLFGLLTLINGKPINNEEMYTNDIQRLLEELSDQQGKYDIALSHHEDGPKSHHEDTAHFSKKEAPSGLLQETLLNLNPSHIRNKPSAVSKSDSDNLLLKQLLSLQDNKCDSAKCQSYKWRSESQSNKEYDSVDEVLELLNDLEKKYESYSNYDSENRCADNKCGGERSNREENENRVQNDVRNQDKYNLRCKGNSCSRNRDEDDDDNRSDRDNLRCAGDRCGRNRDNDDRNDRNELRCAGNRCGESRDDTGDLRNRDDARDVRNRDDARDDRNDLRCSDNRCSINRDDLNDIPCAGDRCAVNRDDAKDDRNDAREDRNDLRCAGNKCNIANDDRNDLRCRCGGNKIDAKDNRDDLRCGCGGNKVDASDNRNDLRCSGNKCNLNRDDVIDLTCNENRCGGNKADDDRDDTDNLRCRGNNCVRSKYYNDNNNNLRYESQRRPKQFKISEDLDAVILDMADLDRLLSSINIRKNKLRGSKLIENFYLNNHYRYNNANDKKANVEAVVFDLENKNDRDVLSKSIKRLLGRSN